MGQALVKFEVGVLYEMKKAFSYSCALKSKSTVFTRFFRSRHKDLLAGRAVNAASAAAHGVVISHFRAVHYYDETLIFHGSGLSEKM